MQPAAKIDSSEFTDLNKVIGWFSALRWIACAGVAATLLVIRLRLLYRLPFPLLFAITALLGLPDLSFMLYFRLARRGNLSRREMVVFFHVQIICDYLLLFCLVYFAGFLENPFVYFFVFHIMLTAFIFSPEAVFVYVGALVAFLSGLFLAEYTRLIPHFSLFGDGSEPPTCAATCPAPWHWRLRWCCPPTCSRISRAASRRRAGGWRWSWTGTGTCIGSKATSSCR